MENVTRVAVRQALRRRLQGRRAAGRAIDAGSGQTYAWDGGSTYVQNPPYFEGITQTPRPITDIVDARILGLFGDKITTDHISPAGSIKTASPGRATTCSSIRSAVADFNQYGTRRGNHEVMMRGTFANIRIKNLMAKDAAGTSRRAASRSTIRRASRCRSTTRPCATRRRACRSSSSPAIEYGTGSSRDWAAKGTKLLGVRAVIAQSFERIHRSNLVGMGVVPFVFEEGTSWQIASASKVTRP